MSWPFCKTQGVKDELQQKGDRVKTRSSDMNPTFLIITLMKIPKNYTPFVIERSKSKF